MVMVSATMSTWPVLTAWARSALGTTTNCRWLASSLPNMASATWRSMSTSNPVSWFVGRIAVGPVQCVLVDAGDQLAAFDDGSHVATRPESYPASRTGPAGSGWRFRPHW